MRLFDAKINERKVVAELDHEDLRRILVEHVAKEASPPVEISDSVSVRVIFSTSELAGVFRDTCRIELVQDLSKPKQEG